MAPEVEFPDRHWKAPDKQVGMPERFGAYRARRDSRKAVDL